LADTSFEDFQYESRINLTEASPEDNSSTMSTLRLACKDGPMGEQVQQQLTSFL
jgi:hypothetical protein